MYSMYLATMLPTTEYIHVLNTYLATMLPKFKIWAPDFSLKAAISIFFGVINSPASKNSSATLPQKNWLLFEVGEYIW